VDDLEHDRLSSVRIDVWLWSVLLTSTRSAATELCRNGRVTLNAAPAKAASTVKIGDRVEARIEQRERIVVASPMVNLSSLFA
jgi:ribosome-associated heat shock protein Hsp15